MHTARSLLVALALPSPVIILAGVACERKAEPAKPITTPTTGATAPKPDAHGHDHADGHDHDKPSASKPADSHAEHDHGDDHGHGPVTQLGEQTAGGFTIIASRDGSLTPGKDAPIDARVTSTTAKVVAVRFWVGTQDAKGSLKAKASLEKDAWHTHVEVPATLPADSKLWVEVESDKGEKTVVGFALKN
jgi:hypothetical protein